MEQFQKQQARPTNRRALWLVAAIVTLLAGASYPATNGWKDWPFSVSVGDDGVIRNEDGDPIGLSVDNEDGSSTSVITNPPGGGYAELHFDHSVKGKDLHLAPGEPEAGGKAGGDNTPDDKPRTPTAPAVSK
jgi:hypothetical protein